MSDPKPCRHDLLNCFECEYPAPAPVEKAVDFEAADAAAKWIKEAASSKPKAGRVARAYIALRAELATAKGAREKAEAEVERLTDAKCHCACHRLSGSALGPIDHGMDCLTSTVCAYIKDNAALRAELIAKDAQIESLLKDEALMASEAAREQAEARVRELEMETHRLTRIIADDPCVHDVTAEKRVVKLERLILDWVRVMHVGGFAELLDMRKNLLGPDSAETILYKEGRAILARKGESK